MVSSSSPVYGVNFLFDNGQQLTIARSLLAEAVYPSDQLSAQTVQLLLHQGSRNARIAGSVCFPGARRLSDWQHSAPGGPIDGIQVLLDNGQQLTVAGDLLAGAVYLSDRVFVQTVELFLHLGKALQPALMQACCELTCHCSMMVSISQLREISLQALCNLKSH